MGYISHKNAKIYQCMVIFAAALGLTACNGSDSGPQSVPADPNAGDYPGIDEMGKPITQLSNGCTWVSTNNGTVTVTVDNNEVAVVAKATSGSNILVNSQTCTGSGTTATTANTKIINIVSHDSAENETVIIDYSNGLFGTATSTTTGIFVNLGTGGTDYLKIRGSSSADTYTFGKSNSGVYSVAVNSDAYPDITIQTTTPPGLTVSGGPGNDVISGAGSTATGNATDVALKIYGGDGNDTLTGGAGADTVYGGAGNDLITGAAGGDTLYGEAGDDTFNEGSSNSGTDFIYGGDGTADLVDYSSRTLNLTIALTAAASSGVSGENDTLDTTIENAKGGSGDDTITGNSSANVLYGNAGADIIYGKDGNDTLNGGDGDDTFNEDGPSTNGADVFNGNAGTDLVDYSSRTGAITATIDGTANDGETGETDNIMTDVENIKGGSADDTLTGSSSNNTLWGNGGADTLSGGAGNDVLYGGAGADVLNGNAGDDTFNEEGPGTNGGDIFNGGDGVDTVDYTSRTAAVTVTMNDDTANDGESSETDNVKSDVENLFCPSGNYVCTVTGNDSANEIVGGDGSDTLFGLGGNDTLDGHAGDNQWLDGGDGDGDICMYAGSSSTTANCEL